MNIKRVGKILFLMFVMSVAMDKDRIIIFKNWRFLYAINTLGASPYYSEKIGNPILRQINQSLRNVKIPLNNWRTADKGHFHWKWGNKETEEWFWLRK